MRRKPFTICFDDDLKEAVDKAYLIDSKRAEGPTDFRPNWSHVVCNYAPHVLTVSPAELRDIAAVLWGYSDVVPHSVYALAEIIRQISYQ